MTGPYFPNQSFEVLDLEARFRQHAAQLPQPSRLALYEVLSACGPSFERTRFVGKEASSPSNAG
jgi:hypothetical protein